MNTAHKKNKHVMPFLFLLLFIISNICQSCNNLNSSQNDFSKLSQKDYNLPSNIDLNIHFVLPKYIYNSKDDLFYDFFIEFYNFVINIPGGQSHLKTCNIKSVGDVYTACKSWDKNSGVGLPVVGKAFSQYFLHEEKGGDFENQKNYNFFVGYCLNNDKFVDFLYFMQTFFYHFRLDEGYTGKRSEGKDPHGSDFFASSYASIIDTAKFFYYTKDTLPSYFKIKKNIPDLYDKIPGILKTPFDNNIFITYDTKTNNAYTLPHDFDCYGYKFIGYYTDPEFKSMPISYVDNDFIATNNLIANDNAITLYAKFEKSDTPST